MAAAEPPITGLSSLEAVEQRAEERGRESAKLKAQVDSHERRLNAINGSIDRLGREVRSLSTTLGESIAVATARAEDAKAAAENQVTKRQFVLGLVGAVLALGLLIVSALALTGHA